MTDAERARLDLLIPEARAQCMRLIAEAETLGMRLSVGQTARTRSEQEKLWAEGTKTANAVSWHELRRAWHLYVIDPATGKRDIMAKPRFTDYQTLAKLADSLGIRQLGFKPSGEIRYITTPKGETWDPFHFEHRKPYATLREAVRAEAPHLATLL